jgi:hypothetical protein
LRAAVCISRSWARRPSVAGGSSGTRWKEFNWLSVLRRGSRRAPAKTAVQAGCQCARTVWVRARGALCLLAIRESTGPSASLL